MKRTASALERLDGSKKSRQTDGFFFSECKSANTSKQTPGQDEIFSLKVSFSSMSIFLDDAKKASLDNYIEQESHLFLLIIEMPSLNDKEIVQLKSSFLKDKIIRPMIIQINLAGKKEEERKYFYKESASDEFKEVTKSKTSYKPDMSFGLLISILESPDWNEKDKFDDVLLRAIISNDTLSVRYLISSYPNCDENSLKKALETAVEKSTPQVISALLNLPINTVKFNTKLTLSKVKTLICCAAKIENVEVLEFLAQLTSENDKTKLIAATNTAIYSKNFENLYVLLNNDFPFPSNNKIGALQSINKTLENLIKERVDLHNALRINDEASLVIVKKFIENNPNIKIGYSPENKSALEEALCEGAKNKNFDNYSCLKYHRYSAINETEYFKAVNELSDDDKWKIRCANIKFYGRDANTHIHYIYSRTRHGFENDLEKHEEYCNQIKFFLEELNNIEKLVPILKFLENSELLAIVFDFDHDAINKLDLWSTRYTRGLCYYNIGLIYVAAKGPKNIIIGTLAHELTHYVMDLMYNNLSQPFEACSHTKKLEFEKIVNQYKNEMNHDEIVQFVFDDSSYTPEQYNCELIVRAPHMYATYQTVDKNWIPPPRYEKLFKWYDRVLEEINEKIKNHNYFLRLRKRQTLNSCLNSFKKVKSYHNSTPMDKNIINAKSIQLVTSEVTKLTEASILQNLLGTLSFMEISSSYFFTSSENFQINFDILKFYEPSCDNLVTFVVRFDEHDDFDELEKMLAFIADPKCKAKFILLCNRNQVETVKKSLGSKSFDEPDEVVHCWDHLSIEMKKRLLQKKVNFQGIEISLNTLLHGSSAETLKFPIKELFRREKKVIGEPIQYSKGFNLMCYIPRKFCNLKVSFHKIGIDSLIELAEKGEQIPKLPTPIKSFIVIVDSSGKGKSTGLSYLACKVKEKYMDRIVTRVDLHQHTDAFQSDEFEDVTSTVIRYFLKPKDDFECALFRYLYEKGKVVILLDGFDEISPAYKKQFLTFLQKIEETHISQLWVTTRKHLVEELREKVSVKCFYFDDFDEQMQKKFLIKYWNSQLAKGLTVDNILEECAAIILQKLKTTFSLKYLDISVVGVPLQTKIIADIFFLKVKEFVGKGQIEHNAFEIPKFNDQFSLFEWFHVKLVLRAHSERGEGIADELAESFVKNKINDDHEKLALKEIFGIEGEIGTEKHTLERYGMITYHGNQLFYVHRAFAAYFIVRSIIDKLPQYNHELFKLIISNLMDYGEFFEMAVNYFNKTKKPIKTDEMWRAVAKYIDSDRSIDLHCLAYQRKILLIDFLVKCLQYCSDDTIKEILEREEDRGGRNIFMLTCRWWIRSPIENDQRCVDSYIWELVKKVYNDNGHSYFLRVDKNSLNVFQIVFMVYWSRTNKWETVLDFLNDIANDLLSQTDRKNLILGSGNYQYDFNFPLNKLSHISYVKCFHNALSFKFKIAKEFADKSDEELIEEENLFSLSIKFLIENTKSRDNDHNRSTDEYLIELFNWANKTFESKEAFSAFNKKFFELSSQHLKIVSNKTKLFSLVRDRTEKSS